MENKNITGNQDMGSHSGHYKTEWQVTLCKRYIYIYYNIIYNIIYLYILLYIIKSYILVLGGTHCDNQGMCIDVLGGPYVAPGIKMQFATYKLRILLALLSSSTNNILMRVGYKVWCLDDLVNKSSRHQ